MGTKSWHFYGQLKKKKTKGVSETEEKYHQEIKNNNFGIQYELQWWFLLSQGMICVMKKIVLQQQKSNFGKYTALGEI